MGIWFTEVTQAQIDHLLAMDTMVSHIGIDVTEISEDYLRGRMPVDKRTCQPHGILHGDAIVFDIGVTNLQHVTNVLPRDVADVHDCLKRWPCLRTNCLKFLLRDESVTPLGFQGWNRGDEVAVGESEQYCLVECHLQYIAHQRHADVLEQFENIVQVASLGQ